MYTRKLPLKIHRSRLFLKLGFGRLQLMAVVQKVSLECHPALPSFFLYIILPGVIYGCSNPF